MKLFFLINLMLFQNEKKYKNDKSHTHIHQKNISFMFILWRGLSSWQINCKLYNINIILYRDVDSMMCPIRYGLVVVLSVIPSSRRGTMPRLPFQSRKSNRAALQSSRHISSLWFINATRLADLKEIVLDCLYAVYSLRNANYYTHYAAHPAIGSFSIYPVFFSLWLLLAFHFTARNRQIITAHRRTNPLSLFLSPGFILYIYTPPHHYFSWQNARASYIIARIYNGE